MLTLCQKVQFFSFSQSSDVLAALLEDLDTLPINPRVLAGCPDVLETLQRVSTQFYFSNIGESSFVIRILNLYNI